MEEEKAVFMQSYFDFLDGQKLGYYLAFEYGKQEVLDHARSRAMADGANDFCKGLDEGYGKGITDLELVLKTMRYRTRVNETMCFNTPKSPSNEIEL